MHSPKASSLFVLVHCKGSESSFPPFFGKTPFIYSSRSYQGTISLRTTFQVFYPANLGRGNSVLPPKPSAELYVRTETTLSSPSVSGLWGVKSPSTLPSTWRKQFDNQSWCLCSCVNSTPLFPSSDGGAGWGRSCGGSGKERAGRGGPQTLGRPARSPLDNRPSQCTTRPTREGSPPGGQRGRTAQGSALRARGGSRRERLAPSRPQLLLSLPLSPPSSLLPATGSVHWAPSGLSRLLLGPRR